MKRPYLISLFFMFIIISLSVAAEANILTNPGFETGSTEGWAYWCMNSTVTDAEKHSKTYSVELALPTEYDKGALIQELTTGFSVGKPLYVTAWIKTDNLDVFAYLKLEFWDKDIVQINSIEGKKITGTSGWTKINVFAPSVPANTTMVKLLLQLDNKNGKGSKGKVYFDDVYLDILPEQVY